MIPPSFKPAIEHGVLPIEASSQSMGLSFKLDDGTFVRLRVPVGSMRSMVRGIQAYLGPCGDACHSANSSGSPSVDGSTAPGQSVLPPTSSPSAESGL